MITAIDSSVLWSIFKAEPTARDWVELLVKARETSELALCEVVYAEVAPLFGSEASFKRALQGLGTAFDPITPASAFMAGQLFKTYRQQGGPREHLLPDFLIGAHAFVQADALAAVDRGYLRRYFPRLKVIAPA